MIAIATFEVLKNAFRYEENRIVHLIITNSKKMQPTFIVWINLGK